MIVSGDPIGADEALEGRPDRRDRRGRPRRGGRRASPRRCVAEKRPLRKIRDLDDKIAAARGKPEVFAEFRKSIARQTRGFRAPENMHQGASRRR